MDALSTAPMSVSVNEIKESASGRLRQDLPSGTYDRFGRPTLKPVFSDINASLRPGTSTTLLNGVEKRRYSLNLSSTRQKRPSKSLLPMDSFPTETDLLKPANPEPSKIRSVTTQTTDNGNTRVQKHPELTSETLFAFDIHGKKKNGLNSSQESHKSTSEKTKRPRSSGKQCTQNESDNFK